MDFPNNSISLPNGVWSSRTQTLQSLSDDQLSAIREQSRASLHNSSPQSYSKVTINGREYSVTYHPQDDLFAVERINGCQGRLVQWLYNMAGHPRGQITGQLTYQLNSPDSRRNYHAIGTVHGPREDISRLSSSEWASKFVHAALRQNAGETLTTEELDFSYANFDDVNINELFPSNLRERMNEIIIRGFNFSNARFYFTSLSDFHFDQCKFTDSKLSCANFIGIKISNSDLSGVNITPTPDAQPISLTNVTVKNSIIRLGINLSGVVLHEPDNSLLPISSAIRVGDAWLLGPSRWSERVLDLYLNHENNNGESLLMTIDSLPEKYSQEKIRAMEDVVTSLRDARLSEADIRPVESSLVSVLAHPPYTQSALIREWLGPVQDRFFAHQCQNYNDVPLPAPDTYHQQRILPVLLDSFDRNSAAMATHSGLFNQVVLHCMTGGACTDDTRQKAAALYERYLAHPAVSPHINNGLFGDYNGSPDWTTHAADNFLLVSSRTSDTAMMLSADTLLTMLTPTPDTTWDRFYLLRGGENVSTAQISPGELFRHDFPVFHAAFNQQAQQRRFGQLIDTIL
ncbi:hypothetical protein AC322_25560, partial [Salmonella enterica subsp. salamae]|nr:hypothetical protein [Salmonella enterica subsp. salamae]